MKPSDSEIKPATGSYVLILHSATHRCLVVGRLGTLMLVPGYYAYVGSAFGPGGVAARIHHHRTAQERQHWHIDYLKRQLTLAETWFSYGDTKREHQWAALLQRYCSIAMPGFGASDCRCSSHLFFCSPKPDFEHFNHQTAALYSGHEPIFSCKFSV